MISCTGTNIKENSRAPSNVNADSNDYFTHRVKPILDKRCVACHSCTEAPCMLHFSSYEGLIRGLNPNDDPFPLPFVKNDPNRLKDAMDEIKNKINNQQVESKSTPTIKNFSPIIEPNVPNQDSILNLALIQGRKFNDVDKMSLSKINKVENRMCPINKNLVEALYAAHPQTGMPYALPKLTDNEYEILNTWLTNGALGPTPETRTKWNVSSNPDLVKQFEDFLNQNSSKSKLAARYIYEHSFAAHFHFDETPDDEFYLLIRSPNSPGSGLATEYPKPALLPMDAPFQDYDDKKDKFYYRFKKYTDTVVRKTHIPWELNNKVLDRWNELFLTNNSQSTYYWSTNNGELKYDNEKQYEIYADLPVRVRYQFLIDNAENIIKTLVRTPVCSGKAATYAVKDHFWLFFLDAETNEKITDPLAYVKKYYGTPGEKLINESWDKAKLDPSDLGTFDSLRSTAFESLIGDGLTEKNITPSIALTLFRHNTSVTLHKGLIGGIPPRIWVVSYENLEEIYYNLVAKFEPWGTLTHQYITWRNMVNERIQGENTFREFFITDKRCKGCANIVKKRGENTWFPNYKKLIQEKDFQTIPLSTTNADNFTADNIAELFLYRLINRVNSQYSTDNDDLNNLKLTSKESLISLNPTIDEWERQMINLSHDNKAVSFPKYLPNVIFFRVNSRGQDYVYTMQVDKVYESNKWVSMQNISYNKEANEMVITRGLLGDRPELFIEIHENNLRNFISDLKAIREEKDWNLFKVKYATLRNDPKFWNLYDFFNDWDKTNNTTQSGVFDLNQYDMTFK